jgi:undecaprenyl-diphosphatase
MDFTLLLTIILLGIVEGVTEFIPVSSTGHLILAGELLGYDAAQWAVFNVVIQLGAILAVIVLYWRTFWAVLVGLIAGRSESWRFLRNVAVGFLPSAVLGLLLIDRIEAMLGSPAIVAWALLLGGVAILLIERVAPQGHEKGVADISLGKAAGIGLIQCLAMIPGVSRSGATILGGLSLGVERRTAAEFSFFLAVPTMLGASTLELYKHHDDLGAAGLSGIAVGFLVSFLVALVVIRWFISIVSRRGFAPFGWYRIIVGGAALIWLAMR